MKIKGIEGLAPDMLQHEIERGGRFVFFQYCISVMVLTFKRSSDIYFLKAGESAAPKAIAFSAISLVCGWWGIPWGPIWTISTIVTNCRGGRNVTAEVVKALRAPRAA